MYYNLIYRKSDGAIVRVINKSQHANVNLTALGFNPLLFDHCKLVTPDLRFNPAQYKIEDGVPVKLSEKPDALSPFKVKRVRDNYEILLVGDNLEWNTGFGTQYKQLAKSFERRGYNVQQVPFTKIRNLKDTTADFVICLADYSMIQGLWESELDNLIYWFALESDEWPPEWDENLRQLRNVVPLTRYGKRALQKHRIGSMDPIPHGVDSEVFKIIPMRQRGLLRKQNQIDNKFVISYLGTNAKRKRLDLLVESYAKFLSRYDKDRESILLLKSKKEGAHDIQALIALNSERHNLPELKDHVRLVEKEMTDSEIAQFIGLSDLGLNATSGEGFCVPIVEYQMCGVPFLMGHHTTAPELIGDAQLVNIAKTEHDPGFKWTRYLIDTSDAADKIYHYFALWQQGKMLDRRTLRDRVLGYSVNRMSEAWDKLLEKLERESFEKEYIEEATRFLEHIETDEAEQKVYEQAVRTVEHTVPSGQDVKWVKVF